MNGVELRATHTGEQKTKLLDRQGVAFKSCKVICRDTEGIEHAVNVTAESLYDAVAQGLKVFRTSEWVSPIAGNTVITVRIKEAEIEHRVRVRDFEAWLDRINKSPGEMIRKERIRERLKP